MTREDIIKLAREAGFADDGVPVIKIFLLERFADLVSAAERRKHQADIERWKTEAAIAKQPARQPLTEDAVIDAFCTTPNIHQHISAFKAGVRFAERAHGISGGQQ